MQVGGGHRPLPSQPPPLDYEGGEHEPREQARIAEQAEGEAHPASVARARVAWYRGRSAGPTALPRRRQGSGPAT